MTNPAPFDPFTAYTEYPPAEMLARSRAFAAEMQRRRTIRQFSDRPVARAVIDACLEAAGTAPSGANQQPWRFVVVRDAEIKRQIREAAEAEEKENYEHRFPEEWIRALEPFGTDWHKPYLETAPYLIVVLRIDYGIAAESRIKHYYVHESVGIAVGFLLAALHVEGLATLVHTPSPMGFLARILDRPANERPFLLIPVGYPAPDAEVPELAKKPLDEVMVVR